MSGTLEFIDFFMGRSFPAEAPTAESSRRRLRFVRECTRGEIASAAGLDIFTRLEGRASSPGALTVASSSRGWRFAGESAGFLHVHDDTG